MADQRTSSNEILAVGASSGAARLVEEVFKFIPGLVGSVCGAAIGEIVSELIRGLFGVASKLQHDLARLEQSIDGLRLTILVTALETGRKQAERALVLPATTPPETARKEARLACAIDRLDEAYTLAGQLDQHSAIRFGIRFVQGICELSISGGNPSARQAFNECAAAVEARREEIESVASELESQIDKLRDDRKEAEKQSRRPKETRERIVVTPIRNPQMRMMTDQGHIERTITETVHDPSAWEGKAAEIDQKIRELEAQLEARKDVSRRYAKLAGDLRDLNEANLEGVAERLGEFADVPQAFSEY